MAWLGDNLEHGQLLEGPLDDPCKSHGGLDGPFKLLMVCEWMRKHLHLMSCCIAAPLLIDNHVWQILVFPWRTLKGFNEKLVSLLGPGLQAHTTPLAPARQSQVQVLWLTHLHSFPLLLQEVSDDIIPSKSFLYNLPLISLIFIFQLLQSWELPRTSRKAILWLGGSGDQSFAPSFSSPWGANMITSILPQLQPFHCTSGKLLVFNTPFPAQLLQLIQSPSSVWPLQQHGLPFLPGRFLSELSSLNSVLVSLADGSP